MKRRTSQARHSHRASIFLVGLSVAVCFVFFTEEGLAKGKGGRPVVCAGCGLAYYPAMIVPGSSYDGPPDGSPPVTFSASAVPVAITAMDIDGSLDALSAPKLPPPGSSIQAVAPVSVTLDLKIGPSHTPLHIDANSDMMYRAMNTGSSASASFETEMLALTLTGSDPVFGPITLRESPTLPSLGQHTLTLLPDGQTLQIDSFFDVFFEISVNNGPFVPADSSFHLDLTSSVPEPSSLALAGLGVVGLIFAVRRGGAKGSNDSFFTKVGGQ